MLRTLKRPSPTWSCSLPPTDREFLKVSSKVILWYYVVGCALKDHVAGFQGDVHVSSVGMMSELAKETWTYQSGRIRFMFCPALSSALP